MLVMGIKFSIRSIRVPASYFRAVKLILLGMN